MQNSAGQNIDLYIPRKCSWTNRLLSAKDHASVQIAVAQVDANGVYTGQNDVYALAGYIRNKGEGDMALTELTRRAEEKN
ncbi:40S ribosomal protein S21 [Thraustotheca clavata]|uniref:40S ribosomal protein S21 n=1 Tax=Thraustotheca clavata TaxID=74557 RepID=A0A1W0A9N3_9STRA|nr:40S ribosomal protein S21 [Thraustotheca clavata]